MSAQLVLLGTQGGPHDRFDEPGRCGTARLLRVGGRRYLFDAGKGALLQLQRLGEDLRALERVLLTHLHSDHVYDFGNVLYQRWLEAAYGGATVRTHVHGPDAVARLVDATFDYYAPDVASRVGGDVPAWWREDVVVTAYEPAQLAAGASFEVFADDRVAVRAVGVHHPPLPSVGYRIDTEDLSIAISGDTTPLPAVVELARGCDVLIHEAFHRDTIARLVPPTPAFDYPAILDAIHTTPEDVGRIAAEAGVGRVVLEHLYPSSLEVVPEETWRRDVARHYDGEVVVGSDLLTIE